MFTLSTSMKDCEKRFQEILEYDEVTFSRIKLYIPKRCNTEDTFGPSVCCFILLWQFIFDLGHATSKMYYTFIIVSLQSGPTVTYQICLIILIQNGQSEEYVII